MTSPQLEADRVVLHRGGRPVLNGLTFQVNSGEVYALLGGNGAGKSTTLLALLGFLEPTAGVLRVGGVDLATATTTIRRSIAYLPESVSLYPHLSARENLRYFLELAGIGADAGALDAALDRVNLPAAARDQAMDGYSKGMRQKTAIALALLREADTLLLDEPTSGLDPLAIDELHTLVRNLADAGRTVLMVTHDVYGACQVAHRIGLLRDGVLVGEFEAEAGKPIPTDAVHQAFARGEAA
ncbi:MAG: ABC transporter ATP-binding protein [Pseudomonadota bacterium]